MKKAILALLWILILFFGFKLYNSNNHPIKFNNTKQERYADVISNLKDIGNAQIAYKSVVGVYANDFKSLVEFIDTAEYVLLEKRDSSYLEYDRTYRIDMLREVVVIDTLGFASVKDSLFKNSDRYKTMMKVPVKGVDTTFVIKSDILDKNGYKAPVFEVKVNKEVVLHDQNKDLLKQELSEVSVDGVNGPFIVLGSLTDVSTNGNWPTIYDTPTKK